MRRKITIHRWLAGASLFLAYGLVGRLDVTGEAVTLSQALLLFGCILSFGLNAWLGGQMEADRPRRRRGGK